ncbi:F-box protein [Cardamine amara subsp. amara]|uniref:F-box protein n=1 Tax=Cardamine amara subsp. amara TaxID=228776 RepID=A0ABD1B5P1_CARAN
MRPLELLRQRPPPSPKMASPSRSPTTIQYRGSQNSGKKASNPSLPSFADLPLSLIEIIMSYLILEDNIRASAACKSWLEAAVTVRVVEKHPWLMCFPKRGNMFELRDPLQWKLYTLNLPELVNSTVCYSRDGWLLMRKSRSTIIFFFNPFSRELINLPKCELAFGEIAFSCPPTSDKCMLLALKFVPQHLVTIISTCHPGATKWITEDFHTEYFTTFCMESNIVYRNDRFYCFNAGGSLYNFEPSSRTWSYICADDLICPYIYHSQQYEWKEKGVVLVEKKGELYVIFTCGNEKPMVYKLFSLEWKEMDSSTVDGLTFFVSFYNSEVRTNLPWMRNNVYFSRFGYNRKRCVFYSFDESRFSPRKEWQNWVDLCPPQSVWIDPPKNVLDIL